MSGLSSTESFLQDPDLRGGLFLLQAAAEMGFPSADIVSNEFLPDRRSQPSIGRDISDTQILECGDKEQDNTAVVGPMPQSMADDSSSSMQAAATAMFQAGPGRDENTPNISGLNPVSSVDGAQINHAPSLPPFPPSVDNGADDALSGSIKEGNSSHSKKKKRRKRDLDESVCVPTDDDVLFGRGGDINRHPGNILFREEALKLRPWYEKSSKEVKCEISKILLESVKGRFLEKDGDGLWHEVNRNGARRKASQALRERIKGRGASARSQDSSGDERDDTGADGSLGHSDVDLVEGI
ncbi:hypothetical protein HJC23_003765 [Cyclotella cryptica]|uniref:DUF6824 domain-containing protein n=1 Tax=Cyclotella cryptica TaxID=29204 RepID=A0ABD3QX72_9STRA